MQAQTASKLGTINTC